MKSIISGIILLCVSLGGFSQADTRILPEDKPMYDFLYHELFNFSPNSTFGELAPVPPFLQQKFAPSQSLAFDFTSTRPSKNILFSTNLPVVSPFVSSFSLNNYAEYQLNDNLKFGGNSFSVKSIFSPVGANPWNQNLSFQGASMFLEYKVSKSVRIGGSIGIVNRNSSY